MREADGYTKRDHLMSAWRQTGHKPAELDGPKLPNRCGGLWSDFWDLHVTRRSGLNGPERLSFADLQAWQIVTGSSPEPWEIRALLAIDREYMATLAKATKTGA